MARAELARKIAQRYSFFISKLQVSESRSDPSWRVGAGSPVTYNSLVLVSLIHVKGRVWRAELEVLL